MNILNIVNGKMIKNEENDNIEILNGNEIVINILNDSDLIIQNDTDKKTIINIYKDLDIKILLYSVLESVNQNIIINVDSNSKLLINSFHKTKDKINNTIVNLNGENAYIEYNYSSIGTIEKYLTINHNFKNTNSKVKNHAVNGDNKVLLEITEFVPKGNINCQLSQSSKIINLNDNQSEIRPILLIDEKEVIASHSSIISFVNSDDLLYLMSRGISHENAITLLINGFLINNLNLNKEEKNIIFKNFIFRR